MNAFKVLGIEPTSDKMVIRRAYVQAAKLHHPDHGGSAEKFQIVRDAYNLLITNKFDDTVIETELSMSLVDFLFGCTATAVLKHGVYRGTVLEFQVPAFTYPGTTIEFYDSGSTRRQVRVKLHEIVTQEYIRMESDIVIKCPINILDAELGKTLTITNFDSTQHSINISPETTADSLIYSIAGAGFYNKTSTTRGNLSIIVEVTKKRYQHV